jgi:two-component system response regulator AtoC
MTPTALLLSSDETLAEELRPALLALGLTLARATGIDDAEHALSTQAIDLAFVDVAKPEALDLVAKLSARHPECALLAVTPAAQTATGVQAARSGAADFVRRPVDTEELGYVVNKVQKGLEHEADEPPPSIVLSAEPTMVGSSTAQKQLTQLIARAANGTATVLVRGESGSGKELVARSIHEQSPRHRGPFVKVHCAALPDNLLESELFGYEKGAFTGAAARKPGRVEVAEGGTLFLDEIGDITPAIQVKLLRVLQERQFERLGGNQTVRADVRFVAATHRDLEGMVKKGDFREDLFYRLNVISLWVPPLRERKDDIEALALHFCHTLSAANGRPLATFDADALDLLRKEPWPGNVRQLQNFVERLVVMNDSPRISARDVARELGNKGGPLVTETVAGTAPARAESSVIDLGTALRRAERHALEKALDRAQGNRTVAARLLGISRRALYYKLEEHGLA